MNLQHRLLGGGNRNGANNAALVIYPLTIQIHLEGNNVATTYLLMCCKPSFLVLLNTHGGLIEEYTRHSLVAMDADLLIYISGGDVMNKPLLSHSNTTARAHRTTPTALTHIRSNVNAVVAKIGDAPTKGVAHWDDV